MKYYTLLFTLGFLFSCSKDNDPNNSSSKICLADKMEYSIISIDTLGGTFLADIQVKNTSSVDYDATTHSNNRQINVINTIKTTNDSIFTKDHIFPILTLRAGKSEVMNIAMIYNKNFTFDKYTLEFYCN